MMFYIYCFHLNHLALKGHAAGILTLLGKRSVKKMLLTILNCFLPSRARSSAGSGAPSGTSPCPASLTPWGSATYGGFPISASRTEEVSLGGGVVGRLRGSRVRRYARGG